MKKKTADIYTKLPSPSSNDGYLVINNRQVRVVLPSTDTRDRRGISKYLTCLKEDVYDGYRIITSEINFERQPCILNKAMLAAVAELTEEELHNIHSKRFMPYGPMPKEDSSIIKMSARAIALDHTIASIQGLFDSDLDITLDEHIEREFKIGWNLIDISIVRLPGHLIGFAMWKNWPMLNVCSKKTGKFPSWKEVVDSNVFDPEVEVLKCSYCLDKLNHNDTIIQTQRIGIHEFRRLKSPES